LKSTYLITLINKYLKNTITEYELYILIKYVEEPNSDEQIKKIWKRCKQSKEPHQNENIKIDLIFNNIILDKRIQKNLRPNNKDLYKSYFIRLTVAALFIFALNISYNINQKNNVSITYSEPIAKNTIEPGSSKGIIVLENGQKINLENLNEGSSLHLDNFSIYKSNDGTLSYNNHKSSNEEKTIYNTIITPKGGEYKLEMSDGTLVWLNSSTTFKYPINFLNKAREVELNGEAYFEVDKLIINGKNIPFIVRSGNQKLEVLGTTFNVDSYKEKIKTTLVEGEVKLSYNHDDTEYFLKENQQAEYNPQSTHISIKPIDPFYITSWKNGKFAFDKSSIYEVMRRIGLWYDVDIEFVGDFSGITFTGSISRFEKIEKLLSIIETTESVKFQIKERRLIVMK